ncbi:hypothetical protein E4U54_000461 [Claviceps lovelessii]|nr:hypothetical protein E4U54_000461 [Claviceps lovelessii]
MPENDMSKSDAARIQSTQAKAGKDTSAGSFPARAQSAADRHNNAQGAGSGNSGGQSNSGNNNNGGGSGKK